MSEEPKKKAKKEKAKRRRDEGSLTLRCDAHPVYKGVGSTIRRWCAGCVTLRHIHLNNIEVEVTIKGDVSHVAHAGARRNVPNN